MAGYATANTLKGVRMLLYATLADPYLERLVAAEGSAEDSFVDLGGMDSPLDKPRSAGDKARGPGWWAGAEVVGGGGIRPEWRRRVCSGFVVGRVPGRIPMARSTLYVLE